MSSALFTVRPITTISSTTGRIPAAIKLFAINLTATAIAGSSSDESLEETSVLENNNGIDLGLKKVQHEIVKYSSAIAAGNSSGIPANPPPWHFLDMSQSPLEMIGNIALFFTSLFIVFGGVIPFLFQYEQIRKQQNTRGFSLHVCLALFVANIMRIMFWFGKQFELTLLFQSIIMLLAMSAMVNLVVTTNKKHYLPPHKPITVFDGQLFSFFWEWTDLASYAFVVFAFTTVMAFLTAVFLYNEYYVETIGFISLFIEANLGTSQCLKNHRRKATTGMSIPMVALWMIGDCGKTAYFFVRHAPMQFWICGLIQITVDVLILLQVFLYRHNKTSDY